MLDAAGSHREDNNGYCYAKEHFDRNVLAGKYLKEIEKCLNPDRLFTDRERIAIEKKCKILFALMNSEYFLKLKNSLIRNEIIDDMEGKLIYIP